METRQLKYFIEVYKNGSFSKAAEVCYITASGINLAITRLEDELGCKLFNRTTTGLFLTEHGKFLLPYAQTVVSQTDECKAHFAAIRSQVRRLPVAFSIGTLEEFAGLPLAQFQRENAGIMIDVMEAPDAECDAAVENGEVELALTVGPLNNTRLDATLLYASRNALLVHESHQLSGRTSISARDLEGIPMVIQRETTRSSANFRACCKAAGFEPTISTYADDVLLLFYLSSIGQAAGIASQALARRLNRSHIRVIPFEDPEMAWNIYLIKARGARLSPEARKFESMLINYSKINSADKSQL